MSDDLAKLRASILHWAYNPIDWVSDIFPDVVLTTQQKGLLVELGKLYKAKKKRHDGVDMTDEEREYASKIGISVMSGHWLGKDFISAIILCHFLCNFSFPKIVATANTFKQLKNVFHSEVTKIFRLAKKIDPNNPNSETYLSHQLEIQSEKVFLKAYKGKEWFAEFVTVNMKGTEEEQAESLAGRNADYKLTIVDEASGIPAPVFRPFEGAMSGIINIIIIIFNPTRSKGYAVDSQYKNRERWLCFRWNAEESERSNKDAIKDLEKRYGRDSNTYRIRVLGLPPLADSNVLIPSDWIEDARDREFIASADDPVLCGMDVGGGGDKSVCCIRHGGIVKPFIRNSSSDTMEVAQWGITQIGRYGVRAAFVDVIGLGRGVYDRMRQLGSRVFAADSRAKARDPEQFYNKRAEMFMAMRESFQNGTISLKEVADDQDFIDQLNALKKKEDNQGRIQILKKEELIADIGHSPDESDALAMTFAMPESVFRRSKADGYDAYDEEESKKQTGTWMGA